jgi:serine/threonine protein kinase
MFNWSKRQLGKYALVRKIGSGGMSSVYKAIDQETEKTVAVKVLPPGLDDATNFRLRFEREAKILMKLRHPHIVPLLDFGSEDGIYFMVMPLMEVGTLRDRLVKGAIRPEEGANIIRQIAEALQFAHNAGMVHRDVKPSNILMDGEGNAWLSDFGTAYVRNATASLTGSSVIGTPQYMAPEQARGEPVSEKTDVYALGIVLYQMCTGQLPFDADTPLAIAMKHTSEPLPRPTLINPNIPQEVGKVLIRALEKKPEDRYISAIALSEAFERALELVYDPEARALKPGARRADDDTQDFVPGVDDSADSTKIGEPVKLQPRRRRLTPVLLIGILALIPFVWVISRIASPSVSADDGTVFSTPSPTVDWEATISALSTAMLSAGGAGMSPEQIEGAIAATLQAMVLEAGGPEELATILPTILPTEQVPYAETSLAETVVAQLTATNAVTETPTQSTPDATSTDILPGTSTPPTTMATTAAPLTPSPTNTPTRTLVPTRTSTPTLAPSSTATVPPTHTSSPTVDICSLISVGGFSANGGTASWTISNDSGGTITLESMSLAWPASNDALFNVFLKGGMIWSGVSTTSPTSISSWMGGPSARQVGSSANFEVFFGAAASSGYNLNLAFSNGCQATTSN